MIFITTVQIVQLQIRVKNSNIKTSVAAAEINKLINKQTNGKQQINLANWTPKLFLFFSPIQTRN